MWAALALTTVLNLAPAQAGKLEIKNVRVTYGVLGQTRKEEKILPGDIAVVSFDIHGLKVKDTGDVLYATSFELIEKATGKALLKQDMEDKKAVNNLGGDVLPTMTFAAFGLDTNPGVYTIKVNVKDRASGSTAEMVKEVTVGRREEFGFVRVRFTSASNEPAPPVAVPGQALLLRYALVGFAFGKKDKLPDVTVEMQVLDDAGKPTTEKSAKARVQPAIKDETPFIEFLPIPLQLNRPGKFKVKLTASCEVSGKKAEQLLDLTVLDR
jgi:hypothetical protein